jgi:hypothetical protein
MGKASCIWTRAALLLCATLAAADGRAGAQTREPAERFAAGIFHAGVSAGWGHGYEFLNDQDEVRMLAVVPRVGMGLSDPMGDGWYRGNFDLSFEPQLLVNFDPDGGRAAGAALWLQYQLHSADRIVPFVGGGAGMLGLDFDGRHQDDGFNFILQAGGGVHLFASERLALTFDTRWHHISNAGLRDSNHGIDSGMVLLGPTWFFQ